MKSKKQSTKHMSDITKPKPRATPEPQLIIPKRSVIVPVTGAVPNADIPIEAKATQLAEAKPMVREVPVENQPTPPPEPQISKPEVATAASPSEPSPQTEQSAEPPTTPEDVNADPDAKGGKTTPEVRKALEQAKREQETQKYIENRDFFVPIDAVARKRSIKVSGLLVLLELILGIILLNLMLDAGLIDLLDKIPHTHFFGLR